MSVQRGMPLTGCGCLLLCVACSFLAALQSFWGEISTSINAGRLPVGTLTDVAMVVALNAILCVIVLAIVGGVWTVGRKWWASLPER